MTPIFKKGDKQLIKNYRPIPLLPICGKILEKNIFNNLYTYLHTNNLITSDQSGFRPGDSTTNQILYLVDEIHQAFDSTKSDFFLQGFFYFWTMFTMAGLARKFIQNQSIQNIYNGCRNKMKNIKTRHKT